MSDADHLATLLYAAERPLTQAQLAHRMFGVPVRPTGDVQEDRHRESKVRAVQEACEELRRRSEPLCSSGAGIWMARSADEALDTYRRNRNRAIRQLVTNRYLLKAAERMQGVKQLGMFDAA